MQQTMKFWINKNMCVHNRWVKILMSKFIFKVNVIWYMVDIGTV